MIARRNSKSNVAATIADALAKYNASAGLAESAPAVETPIASDVAFVLDVSSSMNTFCNDGKTRFSHLRTALNDVLPHVPGARLVWFSTDNGVAPTVERIPAPFGSTLMGRGLDLAGTLAPSHVIVISDGLPTKDWQADVDGEASALAAGGRLKQAGARIDVIFVGDESDTKAVTFMRKLAGKGGGQYLFRKLGAAGLLPSLKEAIRGLLA